MANSVYAKTDKGRQVLQDRSVPLTPRQRTAFILIDGRKTVQEVMRAGATREDVESLLALGLLMQTKSAPAPAEPPSEPEAPPEPARHALTASQAKYARAYPVAARLTAGLGLRGFRLNLAVEAATNYEQLLVLAPTIRQAVGEEKFAALDEALDGPEPPQ